MYDNVKYGFYRYELKRNIIPCDDFDMLAIQNIAYFERLNSVYGITPRSNNGIDCAICMMCEVEYLANKAMTCEENSGRVSSVSVGKTSESYDKSYANAVISANVKPVEAQKMDCVRMFCNVNCGVM